MHSDSDKFNIRKQHAQDVIQAVTQAPSINVAAIKQLIDEENNKVRAEVQEEIRKQIQNDKISLMTIFGVFASITTFLTIEFQFLKTLHSLQTILGFTLILFALLLAFNVALDYIVKSRSDTEATKPNIFFYCIIGIALILGVTFISFDKDNNRSHYYNELENRLTLLQKDYKKQHKALEQAIKKTLEHHNF